MFRHETRLHRTDEAVLTEERGYVNLETRLNEGASKIIQLLPDFFPLPGDYAIDAFPQADMIRECLKLLTQAKREAHRKVEVCIKTLLAEHRGRAEECRYERLVFFVSLDERPDEGVVLAWTASSAESEPFWGDMEHGGKALQRGKVWLGLACFIATNCLLRAADLLA